MARAHVMTARRKAALRKAQLVSARKRKGKKWSKKRKLAVGAGAAGAALVATGVVAGLKNPYNIPKSQGYPKHIAKNAKLVIPGPGSKITTQKIGFKGAMTGHLSAGHGRSISFSKARNIYGQRYSMFTLTGKKVGPLGDSRGITYDHYALFGNKTKNKVRIRSKEVYVDRSTSINARLAQRQKTKKDNVSIKSAILVTKNFPHYVTRSNHPNPLVRRINNEVIGKPVPGLPVRGIRGSNRRYKERPNGK